MKGVNNLSEHIIPNRNRTCNDSDLYTQVKNLINVEQYVKDTGINIINHTAFCPFHQESTPSFHIYSDHFHCFGCGKHGDVIELHAQLNNLTNYNAAMELLEKYGLNSLKKIRPAISTPKSVPQQYLNVLLKSDLHKELKPEHITLLKTRGMSDEVIKQFGYEPRETLKDEDKNLCIDLFSNNRYLFKETIVTISLDDEYIVGYRPEKNPKYIFPKNQNKPLFGAKILSSDYEPILVEGIFDYFSLIQYGFSSICSLGTNLRHQQKNELLKFKKFYICFDGDNSGRKATLALKEEFPNSVLIQLPEGRDVNDLLLELGENGFKDYFNNAKSLVHSENEKCDQKKPRKKQEDILLELCESIELFLNEQSQAYVKVPIENHFEVCQVEGKKFQQLLRNLFYQETNSILNNYPLTQVVSHLSAKAWLSKSRKKLFNRIAEYQSLLLYDLANSEHQVVQISKDRWEIVNNPPAIFLRYSHMQPQPHPDHSGDPHLIFKYINLLNSEDKLLFLVTVISYFIYGFPHPAIVFYGGQGTAKSTTSKIIRQVVDPSLIQTFNGYWDKKAFSQYLNHNHMAVLDNLSEIGPGLSDQICSAISGDGDSKRVLFSDDDDLIYSYRRCFILNGINLVTIKSDLLDRTILFELERIPNEARKEERAIWNEFENDRAYIVGGIFNTLVQTLKVYPEIRLDKLNRMADFTRWGAAISEALGYNQQDFLNAYSRNILRQSEEAVLNNPVAYSIRQFMNDKTEWEGTAHQLLNELERIAPQFRINTRDNDWPKAPNALARRINEVIPNLEHYQIYIIRKRGVERQLLIKKG